MRRAWGLLVILAAACDRGSSGAGDRAADRSALQDADGSLVANATGEVSLTDGSKLQFVVTSERYKQWDAARQGLDARTKERFGQILQPRAPTERSINQATAFLQGNAAARQSISRAGMSVRDFVLMTVALEQEMQLAGDPEAHAPPAPLPMPIPEPTPLPPMPADSGYRPAPVLPPPRYDTLYGTPATRDSGIRPWKPTETPRHDTVIVRRDSVPKPVLPSQRDTSIRRDSAMRRDSVPKPLRDTVRDTLRSSPPDTLQRP